MKLDWRKSSHSIEGNCVEIAIMNRTVGVRDSKNPEGPTLSFTSSTFSAFLAKRR